MSVAVALADGLRARSTNGRARAARQLLQYVRQDLRELPSEEVTKFFDEFNRLIFEMVSSTDVNDKKAGVLAIVCLISGDCDAAKIRISRYANYLRNLFPSSDIGVMEVAAKTVGKLAVISGSKRAEYVEFEVKKSFEWLSVERNEGKRHAAVLILRELAIAMPTYFHQQVSGFFDHIFTAIKDPKAVIREAASKALQAALVVTAQRESVKQQQKPLWYSQCFREALNCIEEHAIKEKGVTRDDRIHGGFLILNELIRCSHAAWERKYTNLMQTLDTQQEINLPDDIISVMPRLKSPLSLKENHSQIRLTNNSLNGCLQPTIYESAVCKQLIAENYDEICSAVLYNWLGRSSSVQQIIMIITPRLSAFNKDIFLKKYLNIAIKNLLFTLKGKEKDRNMAFTTIGLIAIAIETEIKPFIPSIMDVIKSTLPSNDTPSKKKIVIDPAVFVCISLLGNAVGENISCDMKEILEPMMATGLSPALTICLRELSQNLPSIKDDISECLLEMLSLVLMNKPLAPPGLPKNLEQQMSILFISESHDVLSIPLALRTLGSFNFEGYSLLPFVRHIATHFLQSEQQEIRLEAVRTCTQLLSIPIESKLTLKSCTVKNTVSDVLSKLLVVGITDTDCDVRYRVFESLTKIFDCYLAQIENLSSLFIAMNDEVLEIRELAICIIGRLSTVNPAYVMPSLRKALIQFLSELEHSGMSRNKEQSARMLDHLIVNAPRLIRPYVEPILNVLVPKLKELDSNPGVILNVLRAIGDLAEINGDGNGLHKWTPELSSILLEFLADASAPEKRGVALWVFGQLISATSQVVTPYSNFPNLMDVLINFLKTEQQPAIRRETIRVLGLLGALDPYKHKMNRGLIDGQSDSNLSSLADSKADDANFDINSGGMLPNLSYALFEEYYPAIAISTLMRIIRDPNLSQHHTSVVQAVTFIFQSLGIKCVPYIPQVIPSLLYVIRMADNNFRDFLFTQLASLILTVKQHIRNYLDKIFDLIKEFWTPNSPLQSTLIVLVEHIAIALGSEFKIYLPQLIPQILRILSHDSSKDRIVTIKLLHALLKFGNNLDDYLHLILPPIVRLFDSNDCPLQVSKVAMETVDHLADSLDFTDLTSRIIHPLVRSLDLNAELRPVAMNTLCALVLQLGRKYNHFIPLVQKLIIKHKISCQRYEVLISRLKSNTTLSMDEDFLLTRHWNKRHQTEISIHSTETTTIKKLNVNSENLRLAWTASRRVSKDDWLEWLRHLSIGLLKESQSPALRACLALAQNYSQLLKDLFNAAFVSCWTELSKENQNELVQALEQALTVPDLPEITQTILNLAEFMDHCERGNLPINSHLLGERAMHCRAYAKALHYKEGEFRQEVNSNVVEALILINNKLQQREAAEGLLEYVMARRTAGQTNLQVQVRWYEKLHSWEKAYELYSDELMNDPSDMETRLGQMRCLEALGEWGELHDITYKYWDSFEDDGQSRAGRLGAAAAWGLGEWESMQKYVQCIPSDSQDGAFYRAVLAVHAGQYDTALQLVEQTRDLLDNELTAMAGESYQRAYGAVVWVQMLAELEEVIQYKLVPERRSTIRSMWWKRLQGGQKLVEDWQRILRVHRLVINPNDDVRTWLKYASLCRKSGSLKLAHKTLIMLLGSDPSQEPDLPIPFHQPQVALAYCKLLWVKSEKMHALNQLQQFVDTHPLNSVDDTAEWRQLLARCYLKLGSWRESLEGVTESSIPMVLQNYTTATNHAPDWYKAWHAWAYMNFEAVLFYKHKNGDNNYNPSTSVKDNKANDPYISKFTVPAVEGFFKSIKLSHGSSLQDTLRLLTLWFDYGQWPKVHEAIVEGLKTVEINTWLQVIPQLIARIDTPRPLVSKLINTLLIDIGKSHPQALVYPLSVASKSSFIARRNAANHILKSMRMHSANLVNQAMMTSEELIRVAILWHEQWHEGLEEASRLYFGEKNIKGMFDTLEPLHAMLERGPQTHKETSFNQAYGRDLNEAQEWCNRYKVSHKASDLNQAWDLYYHVFRRISRQLPQLTSLELQYVSPNLLQCTDFELAVPGTYRPGQEIIRIASIQSNLQVITSKQRPRRLCIRGSNGKEYMFLLKGHEDLRQDERVMQLFGLVNTLLQNDPDTFRRNLTIQRYAVIPLSTNSGLIGWVPHCDTLHSLIRDYRERKKCLLNIEHRIMLRMASDYDRLMLMQKVEVFEHALELTFGDDLARLLWLKSPSSEVWFERRTNYTRSLAVMSMVGYILGLGDRHPSNLMLDRYTGKILHIDFGDCFEVAVTRDKFPEKIPFRLTRMLINAMEVTGIEGTYRRTCESVMAVLHRNKDSLMAVLEAFVHDPLLNWRLMDTVQRSKNGSLYGETSGGEPASLSAPLPRRAPAGPEGQPEALNKRALAIINRVRDKLTGRDFNPEETLTVASQVDLLIKQATNNENLCQCYIGWCPFW